MIAIYKNRYFNIDTPTPIDMSALANIWSYTPCEGFAKGKTKRGIVYYEKIINIADAEAIFNVAFSANWNGEWCGVEYSGYSNEVELWSNNSGFAEQHDFEEDERGSYFKVVLLSECSAFRMKLHNMLSNKISFVSLNPAHFQYFWRRLVDDLSPKQTHSVPVRATSLSKKRIFDILRPTISSNNIYSSKSLYAEQRRLMEKQYYKTVNKILSKTDSCPQKAGRRATRNLERASQKGKSM